MEGGAIVADKSSIKIENSQYQLLPLSAPHISHKTAKSMTDLTSQTHGELQLATCLFRGHGAILRPLEYSWGSEVP